MNRPRVKRRRGAPPFHVAAAVGWLVVVGCEEKPQQINSPMYRCTFECSDATPIDALSDAYQTRQYSRIEGLFHDDYLFILHPDPNPDPNLPPPPTEWGKPEELRIHRRMFDPQNIPPEEEPLPMALWLTSVNITLAASQPFQLRNEFLGPPVNPDNPDGLPPERWKAWGTEYNTQVLFETQGETDYQVNGTAWFVVAEDLTKTGGEPGRFLLYRWQELSGPSWSSFKALHR